MNAPTLFEMDLHRAVVEEKKRNAPRSPAWFPKNSTELKFRGYTRSGPSACRECAAAIEWWITPTGKRIPINAMPELLTPAIPHWTTCTNPNRFRKAKP
jgi:hypothetical protein